MVPLLCPKCSAAVPDDSRFCNYCGKKLAAPERRKSVKSRGNGTGTAYRRGNTWTARIVVGWKQSQDPAKPKTPVYKTRGGFRTKKDALNFCGQLALETTDRRRLTLEECWNEWSAQHESRVGPSTFAGYLAAYRHFSGLHGTYMDMISVTELQKCMDAVTGHRTRQVMKTTVGLLWRYCVAHNLLDKDITGVLYVGKGHSVQRDPLTDAEIELIHQSIGTHRYAEYLYCLIWLGLRPGEMLELKKEQLHHYIRKDPDGTVTADIWYLIAGKKTAAGKDRVIPVASAILPYVLDRSYVPGTDLLFPMIQYDRKGETFLGFKPMSDEYLNKGVFKKLAKNLVFPENKVPYSARHSFADKLKSADGTDKSKAALIGHSNYLFTADRYQSDTIEELAALVASME